MWCLANLSILLSLSSWFSGSALAQEPHGEDEKKHMGPVAFMFPPNRPWSADADNTPPCGTSSGVFNRTDFPRGEQLGH